MTASASRLFVNLTQRESERERERGRETWNGECGTLCGLDLFNFLNCAHETALRNGTELIPARPSYRGVRGSVWDPDTSRELVGDWGGPEAVWALLCVAERRASRPNGEWGFIVSPPYAGPRAPRGGVTRNRRCTYRPSVIY